MKIRQPKETDHVIREDKFVSLPHKRKENHSKNIFTGTEDTKNVKPNLHKFISIIFYLFSFINPNLPQTSFLVFLIELVQFHIPPHYLSVK